MKRLLLLAGIVVALASGIEAQPCGQPPYYLCSPWGQEVYYYSDAEKTNLVGYEYSGCPDSCSCGWEQAYYWGNLGAPYYTQYCFQCNGCGNCYENGGCEFSTAPDLKEVPAPPRPFPKVRERVFGPQRLFDALLNTPQRLAGTSIQSLPAACPAIDQTP